MAHLPRGSYRLFIPMRPCVLLLFTMAASCTFFQRKGVKDGDAIARVGNEYLYASDLENVTRHLHGADSIAALKQYAENWVRRRLLLQKAKEYIPEDEAGITRKLQEYREALLLYEYEREYITQKLDTAVTEQELQDWYERLKGDFELEKDVYRVNFVRLKPDAPDREQFKLWLLHAKTQEDTLKLNGYCRELSSGYNISEGLWYEEDKLLQLFPLSKFELQQLAANRKYQEFQRNDLLLYMRVNEVLRKGEPAPLDFIKDNLIKAILEKRKLKMLDKAYERIYREGLEKKEAEILLP
ncbi:MAG: hypothetical protein NZM35_00685 [Chitinophagales bacterium]|nr:hypothetical protein [Chitinophagales bacterium]MDW8418360.1 hypothetical protein [Chitinophagales bacterium]